MNEKYSKTADDNNVSVGSGNYVAGDLRIGRAKVPSESRLAASAGNTGGDLRIGRAKVPRVSGPFAEIFAVIKRWLD